MPKPPIDRRDARLTPGERFKNWCAGVVHIWPIVLPLLMGTVYGNSETVQGLVHGTSIDPVDGIHQPAEGNFQNQVRASISDIVAELKRLKANDVKLQSGLQTQDTKNYSKLETMIEAVQSEVVEIRRLVQ